MNRKASALFSLGVSVTLIAGVIWLLNHLFATPWQHHGYGHLPRHVWMMGGSGMGIIMIIFWSMVILAVILLATGAVTNRRPSNNNADGAAREILDQRYARGEIDHGQYEVMKRNLEQRP